MQFSISNSCWIVRYLPWKKHSKNYSLFPLNFPLRIQKSAVSCCDVDRLFSIFSSYSISGLARLWSPAHRWPNTCGHRPQSRTFADNGSNRRSDDSENGKSRYELKLAGTQTIPKQQDSIPKVSSPNKQTIIEKLKSNIIYIKQMGYFEIKQILFRSSCPEHCEGMSNWFYSINKNTYFVFVMTNSGWFKLLFRLVFGLGEQGEQVDWKDLVWWGDGKWTINFLLMALFTWVLGIYCYIGNSWFFIWQKITTFWKLLGVGS